MDHARKLKYMYSINVHLPSINKMFQNSVSQGYMEWEVEIQCVNSTNHMNTNAT